MGLFCLYYQLSVCLASGYSLFTLYPRMCRWLHYVTSTYRCLGTESEFYLHLWLHGLLNRRYPVPVSTYTTRPTITWTSSYYLRLESRAQENTTEEAEAPLRFFPPQFTFKLIKIVSLPPSTFGLPFLLPLFSGNIKIVRNFKLGISLQRITFPPDEVVARIVFPDPNSHSNGIIPRNTESSSTAIHRLRNPPSVPSVTGRSPKTKNRFPFYHINLISVSITNLRHPEDKAYDNEPSTSNWF